MPGLDNNILDAVDHDLLFRRVKADVRSDFIIAPHFNVLFVRSADELWTRLYEHLRSGEYQPNLPISMSIPKERGFSRPGSILYPNDRLVYQLLADASAPTLEGQMDRQRTFSHVLSADGDSMFEPAHESWQNFQNKILELCDAGEFLVKADIANYFERIPQHHLINLMSSTDCPGGITNLLEELLLAFQERDSFGIIQGVYPSDLLGNYFLSDFDAYCELNEIGSARYVDDIFMSFQTENEARLGLLKLIEHLRHEGLHLNEFKSGIRPSAEIAREETEIDDMFEAARQEAEEQLQNFFDAGYGFSVDWDLDDEEAQENVQLIATQILYDAKETFPEQADKIDKFCLPLLRATDSDYGLEDALTGIESKPHLTKLHHSYISKFASENRDVANRLSDYVQRDNFLTDYQRMYALGSLMNAERVSRATCNRALAWLQNRVIAQEARAISAIFVAKHGTANQKRAVRLAFEAEPSAYVRAAMLYAAKYFPAAERRTCKRAWGGLSELNALLAQSI